MNLATFLILFPLIPAIFLLFAKNYFVQKWLVIISSVIIAAACVGLALGHLHVGGEYSGFVSALPDKLITAGDIILALVFLFVCRKLPFKRYWIPLMVVVQYGAVVSYDLMNKIPATAQYLYVDTLSSVMALIIGIVGTLIAIYTVGYMKHYHHEHPELTDRSRFFIASIFLFFFPLFYSSNLF